MSKKRSKDFEENASKDDPKGPRPWKEDGSSSSLWGGRFSAGSNELAFALNASIGIDHRMALQDIRGSIAWAEGLVKAGVLTTDEGNKIRVGLEAIGEEFAEGRFDFQPQDEDIHTAVERRLGERIGPLAGKLHTGRSRNDQVATDFRLWLLDHLPLVDEAVKELQAVLIGRAETELTLPAPGYTHLQRAQPISLGHWWLSFFWPLQRDRERLAGLRQRTAVLPLGSGALAGVPFPVDRHALAAALGFDRPAPNSIDAVSDRDFALECLFNAATIAVHLSRLAESVVLFSSSEFGYLELDDAYATGSSLMPQKKNPDHFELARGKAGTLIGKLAGLLATMKGLPSTYDKDLQEDKAPVFAAVDTLLGLLPVLAGALRTLKVNAGRLRAAIDPAMLATDLADYLVGKGVPFREAHESVGKVVLRAQESGVGINEIELAVFRGIHQAFGEDLYLVFDPVSSINRRSSYGGTGLEAVREQIVEAREKLRGGSVNT